MFNYTVLGILIGLALTIIIMLGSPAVILGIVLATIGGFAGAHLDGKINVLELWNSLIGKGRG